VFVVRVPRDLPRQRRSKRVTRELQSIEAITFDFGNTLVPVDSASLGRVVRLTAERIVDRLGPFDVDAFESIWREERDRQFREEPPRFREVDLADRYVRVLARLRGMPPPATTEPWDQPAAARCSTADEIALAVDVYSDTFVRHMPVPPGVSAVLARLSASGRRLGIVSNWPLAATVDRVVQTTSWDRWLGPIVVSQRVGTIKPHPAIFTAALEALGGPAPDGVLHVGDDWAADVVGAKRSGWRAAWLTGRPADTPLPTSERDREVIADLEIATLEDLVDAFEVADRGVNV
jgi:FMN phosphatase YigB (HAD superfamily)